MKKWSLIVLLSTTLAAATAAAEVQTVAYVDLSKYVGKWHEIASIPQPFQKQCVSNTTAEYGTRPDGEIDVTNKCTKKNGDISVAEGRAKVVDTKTNAKLKVTFTRFFEWIYAFAGDYWIIGLDEEYKYAVVGHPTRDYAWILSRDPAMLQEDLLAASEILKKQGYDTCKLMTTIQTGGIPEHTPLCEYLAK